MRTFHALLAPILCSSLAVPVTARAAPEGGEGGEGGEGELSEEERTEQAKDLYQQAEKHAKKREWKQATERYEQAYYLVPGKHGFAFKVGFAAKQAGDCDKALQYLQHFLRYAEEDKYGDDRKVARELLGEMLAQGCVTEAQLGGMHLSDAERVERARELYAQAEAHAAAEEWSEAVVLYEQAYELVPSKLGFAHKVGLAAHQAGDCDTAHEYLVHFVDYADPSKYAEQRAEATEIIRELEASDCVSSAEMEAHQLENPFEISERRDDGEARKGGKGLLIGGAVLAGLGLGGLGVGVAGFVLAGRSQGQLDALASTDTASGYPDGDYACRDVPADQCPPTLEQQIGDRRLLGLVGVSAGAALLLGGAALITVHVLRGRKVGDQAARLDGLGPLWVRGGVGAGAVLRF